MLVLFVNGTMQGFIMELKKIKSGYVELGVSQEQDVSHPAGILKAPRNVKFVIIPKSLYRELSDKYGDYVMNWVFVDADTIKVRKGLKWDYKHVASNKIEKVF